MKSTSANFKKALEDARRNGLPIQGMIPTFKVSNAWQILESCMTSLLLEQGKMLKWIPQYDEVAEWLSDNKGKGLIMYGDCGLGKTLIGRYAIPLIYLKCLNKVIKVYDAEDMNVIHEEIMEKKLISIDDVGTEDIKFEYGNKRMIFNELLDLSEKEGKLLVITTNLSGNELKEKYGNRGIDRMMSTAKRIEFRGKSMRG